MSFHLEGLIRLTRQADLWFQRARASLSGTIPCGKGCHRCCIGPFAITRLDVERLQRGLRCLAVEDRRAIQDEAARQVSVMERAFPALRHSPSLDDWDDLDIDSLVEQFASLPCPALRPDGSCRVYETRPLTCRLMGIPTDDGEMARGACEVQTSVPIIRLSQSFRREEERLAELESALLSVRHTKVDDSLQQGEEVLLPYGFLDQP
ncbi:MAG: YkgJ family cysteine cluster protein [Nitrospiraceae bacterium]